MNDDVVSFVSLCASLWRGQAASVTPFISVCKSETSRPMPAHNYIICTNRTIIIKFTSSVKLLVYLDGFTCHIACVNSVTSSTAILRSPRCVTTCVSHPAKQPTHNTSSRTIQWNYISVLPHSEVHKVHSVTSWPSTPRSFIHVFPVLVQQPQVLLYTDHTHYYNTKSIISGVANVKVLVSTIHYLQTKDKCKHWAILLHNNHTRFNFTWGATSF